MKRRILSILIALLMLVAALPAFSAPETEELGSGALELDTDPAGGYDGDYVVIYNPMTSGYTGATTGNMTGRILTEIDPYCKKSAPEAAQEPYRIDVDAEIAAENEKREKTEPPAGLRTSYNVGDTKTFEISSYSPGPSSLSFKCVAKGAHCYVWTPAQNLNNYYTLDSIDPSYPQLVCDEFESKFDQMRSSFGDHSNGSEGDGRINLMYYNIDDGFQIGSSNGYVAGYFSSYDYYSNGLPMIHIDTYPCVFYVNLSGEEIYRLDNSYSVFCHEYQHLINYSITGGMDTWLNEAMSAAAEEICYPGSSIVSRIQSWENYYYNQLGDWLQPPHEFEYTPEYELHNGYSMYDWSNSLDYVLPLYSQVCMFSQYLFTHFGNGIFKNITQLYSSNGAINAIASATGMATSDLVKNFRIAVTANDYGCYDGIYGFAPQVDYDPSEYHDLANPYQILGPVVFTGESCSIKPGGSITVKPVNGNYVPPTGASGTLVYIGVTRNVQSEPVALEGLSITPDAATVYTGYSTSIKLVTEPRNANDFDAVWSVSDPSRASISGSGRIVSVTGIAEGRTVVSCTATDRTTGETFTVSSNVTVLRTPTLSEALNVPNGTLEFTTDSAYPWVINTGVSGRLCANSTNNGVTDSSSTVQTTVAMEAGETLAFEWSVSSESYYDQLYFYVNNSEITNISGEVGFTEFTYTAQSSGTYTFKWTYTKDYSVDRGSDMGFLDNVVYSGDPGLDVLIGDVNFDGVVDSVDALMVLRYSLDIEELTPEQLARADVNGDGEVDSVDALTILRISLGIGD